MILKIVQKQISIEEKKKKKILCSSSSSQHSGFRIPPYPPSPLFRHVISKMSFSSCLFLRADLYTHTHTWRSKRKKNISARNRFRHHLSLFFLFIIFSYPYILGPSKPTMKHCSAPPSTLLSPCFIFSLLLA